MNHVSKKDGIYQSVVGVTSDLGHLVISIRLYICYEYADSAFQDPSQDLMKFVRSFGRIWLQRHLLVLLVNYGLYGSSVAM